jgi:hypothetical protein
MKSLLPRLFLLLPIFGLAARADEPAIIAKARAYLGPESLLDGITSVHMVGTFSASSDQPGAKAPPVTQVDIIFQKPWQHRMMETTGKVVRTVALDGFDAWQWIQDPGDPSSPRLTLYPVNVIWALRSDVWENLGYYRGLEDLGGTVEDKGPATIDGVACEKVVFTHAHGTTYARYFDVSTGRLVYTETGTGLQIREEGSMVVDSIRFPERVVTSHKTGKVVQTTTLIFTSIEVNRTFPESDFATPLPPISTTSTLAGSQPGALDTDTSDTSAPSGPLLPAPTGSP